MDSVVWLWVSAICVEATKEITNYDIIGGQNVKQSSIAMYRFLKHSIFAIFHVLRFPSFVWVTMVKNSN